MNRTIRQLENSAPPPAGFDGNAQGLPGAALQEDLRCRVASAIGIRPHRVHIDGRRALSSGLLLQCWGSAAHRRFFAKVYLVDPYPVTPRFAAPDEELARTEKPYRSLEEQITAEWNMVQAMRRLMGTHNIPAPLGHSIGNRIVVYEEVEGVRLDHLANIRWPEARKVRSVEAALFQAGTWLRRLHVSSCQGYDTLHFAEVVDALTQLMRKKGLDKTHYATLAMRALEPVRPGRGLESSARVSMALSHGDFSLPNLIWDEPHQRLRVLDFELSTRRAIVHDLGTMTFELKRLLLHPLTSRKTVSRWEDSFWAGYGEVSRSLFDFVNALAAARIFYHLFPELLTWRAARGLWAGTKASVYAGIFEPFVVRRILRVPQPPLAVAISLPIHSDSCTAAPKLE